MECEEKQENYDTDEADIIPPVYLKKVKHKPEHQRLADILGTNERLVYKTIPKNRLSVRESQR